MICKICGKEKPNAGYGMCSKHYNEHYNKNKRGCNILKKHHEDMKDDPESLTTKFMRNLIRTKGNLKL